MNLVEVNINGLFLTQNQASGIILREANGERALPIIIGEYEAQSIALGLEKIKPPRPITHDLLASVIHELNAIPDRIIVTDLRENTYYAVIQLYYHGDLLEIDSRPSDALALAVREDIPIFVEENVMQKAALDKEPEPMETESADFKVNSMMSELEKLQEKLEEAVKIEDYETAARIRDAIKKLQNNQ